MATDEASTEHTPIATTVSMPEDELSSEQQAISSASRHLQTYRGGFHSSICDIFRDPHRRTDCCAVACCGVLSSDRSRYLLTGELPPPLWSRVLMYLIIPVLFIVAMNYFGEDVPVGDDGEMEKIISVPIFVALIAYIIIITTYGFVKNRSTRKEIMKKLYEERARERGEMVNPREVQTLLNRHALDTIRAHSIGSCCYAHDHHDLHDETGMESLDNIEEGDGFEKDFCTRLWDCLSNTFWCCGCWCQCCGCCALAQEEREVERLTGNEQHKIDYLTFQPYTEYYPAINNLRENEIRSPWKHLQAISDLSSKLLRNVAAVLGVLVLFALSDIDSNFSWENMIVLLLTLGQAFFIEYLVHWRWNLYNLSFDSVIKYFACGFLLTTPMAIVFEMVVSTVGGMLVIALAAYAVASDSELANEFVSDPKNGMKQLMVNYPGIFIFMQFINAYFVAALVEEMVKYFGYRMVVTPDLIQRGRSSPLPTNNNLGEVEPVDENPKSAKSNGAGITVAMVSVALGFACCENIMYVFVYSPPSLGGEITTLLARSFFPVHPLCAAIQSIGVCKRDLEGDKRYGLGWIIAPAILLHGTFDFVLMLAAYFMQVEDIKEGNDDAVNSAQENDASEDLASQLPSLLIGVVLVIIGYSYYVVQSRAQNQRLVAIDNAVRDQNSLLV